MAISKKKYYKAFSYTRLSKEDGDKEESNSIANQKQLIRDYIDKQDDMELAGEFSDDGFTGTNFDRPQFLMMMDAVRRQEADCIVVKDLSRFGRDYIDSGKYIQKIFPMLGIRFVAVNDNIDSVRADQSDDLIIPFKNLINDSYCRDLSIKLRGQFRVQRANGEYIGPYVAYGYRKSKADKHKLLVDETAAEIVKEIFAMKLKGHSQNQIAGYLNQLGVPAPADYKRMHGINYKSGFQMKSKSTWTPIAITRILKNRIYIGHLGQGKRSTPNYKVKKMLDKDPQDWIIVENNHEPIIEPEIFRAVNQALERDTKVSAKGIVYPLSGMLYCGDCGNQMVTRTVTRGNKKFSYFVCASSKYGGTCTSHSYSMKSLEKAVLNAVNVHIDFMTDLKKTATQYGEQRLKAYRMRKFDRLIEEKHKEIEESKEYRLRLYESMAEGIINRDEYGKLRKRYTEKIGQAEEAIEQLNAQLQKYAAGFEQDTSWIDSFLKYREVTTLTRDLVLTIIDKIIIYENKTIEVVFNFHNEMDNLQEFIQEMNGDRNLQRLPAMEMEVG